MPFLRGCFSCPVLYLGCLFLSSPHISFRSSMFVLKWRKIKKRNSSLFFIFSSFLSEFSKISYNFTPFSLWNFLSVIILVFSKVLEFFSPHIHFFSSPVFSPWFDESVYKCIVFDAYNVVFVLLQYDMYSIYLNFCLFVAISFISIFPLVKMENAGSPLSIDALFAFVRHR